MNVFLSYAHEDRKVAEAIAVGLTQDRHRVFYDREDLPAGDGFHTRIREEIARADLLVFLISKASLQEARYTRTELDLFQKRWPNPSGRVLPVVVESPTDVPIPAYLDTNTRLERRGNLVADVLGEVARIARSKRRGRLVKVLGAVAAVVVVAAITLLALRERVGAVSDERCYLTASLTGRQPGAAGPVGPEGLLLEVTYAGTTRAFEVSETGSAPLDVGPLSRMVPAWTIEVKDTEGAVVGEMSVEGCPESPRTARLGRGLELVVGPR